MADLHRLIKQARRYVEQMSDRERKEMLDAQRDSFIRAMTTPCEHGVLDFEQCPDCRRTPEHKP